MAARRSKRNPRADRTALLDKLREQLAEVGAPPEVLDALEGITDIDDALPRLISAGLLPTPEQATGSILETWRPLLRRGSSPLDAELAGVEFLGLLRATGAPEAELPDLVEAMIASVERSASPEGLAMCRTLAVVGPRPIRAVAAAAAQRLVASGITDPPWVAAMGRPKFEGCFGYQDLFGDQQVIAVVFGYARTKHAFPVLIDHRLGGGIKDCYVAEGPHHIRAAYQDSARRGGTEVDDYSPAEALTILDRAVAADPCPVEPDQFEDVGTYLPLLRERMELLRTLPPPGPARRTRRNVHRLKITLRGSKPPIWRRLEVPSATDLGRLHEIIQAAFGWHGGHMWVFTTAAGEYGEPDPELGFQDATRLALSAAAPHEGDRLRYTYDFGDDWEHEILVEAVGPADPGATCPRCLTGRRARPPEDCGGMWGYHVLLEILADPDHPEHAERMEWLGLESAHDLDPAHFDLAEVNASLAKIAVAVERG